MYSLYIIEMEQSVIFFFFFFPKKVILSKQATFQYFFHLLEKHSAALAICVQIY